MKKTHRGKNSKSKKNAKNTCNDTNKYAKKCYFDKATSKGFVSNNPANIRLDEDVFCLRLQKTSSRRLDQGEHIRDTHTSSEDVFKTSWSRPIYSSWSYVFTTFLRRLAKMSSRRLAKTSSRRLKSVTEANPSVDLSLVLSIFGSILDWSI